MTLGGPSLPSVAIGAFRHEAFLYADEREFVDGTAAFVEDGLDAGQPVRVVLDAAKIRLLRERLGAPAERVAFADVALVGRNPARLLDNWHRFAVDHVTAGRPARAIGEPDLSRLDAAELVEFQRHEQLLNLAFDTGPPWWLMCPYDTRAVDASALDEARHSHPVLRLDGEVYGNVRYRPVDAAAPFDAALDPRPPGARERVVTWSTIADVRKAVRDEARRAGLSLDRVEDLVLAVGELAANSLRHASGRGVLRSWRDEREMVHEIEDRGVIDDPLAGRILPPASDPAGRGLWLVNQLCDLVEVRSSRHGTVVRVHMRRR